MWGNDVLDRADSYSYLGILFIYDGKFNKAKCDLFARGNRAMFSQYLNVENSIFPSMYSLSSLTLWLYRLSYTGVKSGDTKGPVF